MNVPATLGVPLIVTVLEAHAAVTPAGRPEAAPMPVAPVVACVTEVIAVLIQTLGLDEAVPTVWLAVTVMVPVAFTEPQPPVSGML